MSGLGFGFRKLGRWNKALLLTRKLPASVTVGYVAGQRSIMGKFLRIVTGHLKRQDLPWEDLDYHYRRSKTQNNDKILIHTGLYLRSITMIQKNNAVYVGVKKGIPHRNKKAGFNTQVHVVAAMHEHGGKVWGKANLPARPLWRPSYEELGGDAAIQKAVLQGVRASLTANGWKVARGLFKNYGK